MPLSTSEIFTQAESPIFAGGHIADYRNECWITARQDRALIHSLTSICVSYHTKFVQLCAASEVHHVEVQIGVGLQITQQRLATAVVQQLLVIAAPSAAPFGPRCTKSQNESDPET